MASWTRFLAAASEMRSSMAISYPEQPAEAEAEGGGLLLGEEPEATGSGAENRWLRTMFRAAFAESGARWRSGRGGVRVGNDLQLR